MQVTFRESKMPAEGGLRTLLATRTDAVSAVRYFWRQAIHIMYRTLAVYLGTVLVFPCGTLGTVMGYKDFLSY